MNKKAIIITVSSLLLLGAGVGTFMYFRNKRKGEDESQREEYGETEEVMKDLGGALGQPDSTEYSEKEKVSGSTQLKFGKKGRRIAILQALLNHYEGQNLKIDGAFGDATRMSLLRSGFPMCAVASQCEVTATEFLDMAKQSKKDPSFL